MVGLVLAADVPSHCAKDEQVVYSCVMEKTAKVMSVCARGKELAYRFGKPGKIELDFKGTFTFWSQFVPHEATSTIYYLGFEHEGDDFSIHQIIEGDKEEPPDPKPLKAEIWLTLKNGKTAELYCSDKFTGTIAPLEKRGFKDPREK